MTKEQLLEFINYSLPANADSIASWLKIKGVRGTHNPSSCPIANYIRQETGEQRVSVDGSIINYGGVTIKTPTKIFDFILNFDSKKKLYKELEPNS